MSTTLIAKATITINASPAKVWDALINPKLIKQYLLGSDVISDWKEGSSIIYKGEYEGKTYEDKGVVLKTDPEKYLLTTHWSPMSGTSDSPENYHKVGYTITTENGRTRLTMTQDNNSSAEEQEQNSKFWQMILENIKMLLEA